jgi:hypothetical protein
MDKSARRPSGEFEIGRTRRIRNPARAARASRFRPRKRPRHHARHSGASRSGGGARSRPARSRSASRSGACFLRREKTSEIDRRRRVFREKATGARSTLDARRARAESIPRARGERMRENGGETGFRCPAYLVGGGEVGAGKSNQRSSRPAQVHQPPEATVRVSNAENGRRTFFECDRDCLPVLHERLKNEAHFRRVTAPKKKATRRWNEHPSVALGDASRR